MTAPRFTAEDCKHALLALLRQGVVWPRHEGGAVAAVMGGFVREHARTGDAALARLADAFSASTVDLLPEWEATVGLSDACTGAVPTLQSRANAVAARLAMEGDPTVAGIVAFAAALGSAATVA